MPHCRPALAALTLAALCPAWLAAQNAPPSPRNANYTMEVRLDPVGKQLEGKLLLTWRNIQDQPTSELPFHLYWNAWRNNRSTWMRERALAGNEPEVRRPDAWSYLDVQAVRLPANGQFPAADLTSAARFVASDDGNTGDRTVLLVPLPRPVEPGQEIQLEMTWRARIPRTFARTGFRGNYFFIAHWFPKLGVYERGGTWNCPQFHAATEFYSDYGVYDVRLTLPQGFVLGATGRLLDTQANADQTVTYRHFQEDVHDFTWTTSPDYLVREQRFEHPGLPPVDMRLLLQPEHAGQEARHFAATRAALQYYGTWYGPYPYGHVTVVDPAYGSGSGGMEYPTLFTCGTRFFNPEGGGSPEGVTVHEAGHQFWFGIVGNDEFRHAWLDEGLNTFSTARTMEAAFGESFYVQRVFFGFLPWAVRDIRLHRMTSGNRLDGYRGAARSDAQSKYTYRYFPGTASRVTYDKTALWLGTLERHLGWDTLQGILSTFFDRWKFRHPLPEDFFAVANEVSGRDLTPFFDQVHRSSNVFDYAIESARTGPVKVKGLVDSPAGPVPATDGTAAADVFESRVVVRRLGEAVWPVEVVFEFENGEVVRDTWDGVDRWKHYTFEKPSRLRFAAVDPERKLLLDIQYGNNTRWVKPQASFAARKWASKWMIWLQDLLNTMAFFV